MRTHLVKILFISLGIIGIWQLTIALFHFPTYILPTPWEVWLSWKTNVTLLLNESLITILETLLGFFLAIIIACMTALAMTFIRPLSYWLLPILIMSQAIPTFAIAPLLVIWFGYGMSSKIVMTIIMVFFPITSAFYDGLRRTESGWVDLAKIMQAKKWRFFWYIRIPAALPSLASGLRVAATIAPIGAVVGEWVGASHGLGYLMLNANARMQIDMMFAALLTLILFSLLLYFTTDKFLRYLIPWQKVSHL